MTAPARVLACPQLSASVRELKLQLGAIEEIVRPDRAPLPTGLAELDAILVGRGIPRGRLTEITGASGSGRTSMLRTLVTAVATGGRWVAYIDATRTLAPRDWAHVGSDRAPLWIVRPGNAARAPWCADLLLRSGAFALVVLDGAPPLSRALAVRLTRLARDVGAAFVVTGEHGGDATGSSVRIRLAARDPARAASGEQHALRTHDHDHAGEGWKTPDVGGELWPSSGASPVCASRGSRSPRCGAPGAPGRPCSIHSQSSPPTRTHPPRENPRQPNTPRKTPSHPQLHAVSAAPPSWDDEPSRS